MIFDFNNMNFNNKFQVVGIINYKEKIIIEFWHIKFSKKSLC